MKSLVFKPIWLMLALALISTATNAAQLGVLTYEVTTDGIVITDCDESATEVDIPEKIGVVPVTSIGQSAFGYSKIISVTIPDSVTSIGVGAFMNCESLASVNIPDSVTSIGDGAFHRNWLERLVIPEAFHSRKEARRIGAEGIYPWGFYLSSSATSDTKASIRMAPVIMVQGEEGSLKTLEVASTPDGPWRFWMTVTATESGVAITDLDGQASKRFYRVVD
ncbi:leucine-rich repeat domain-containing protein [bacterium]|nr:leucine-rich repeat domain-containing protein [bacterium]